jgi:hypothetical protein
VAKLQTGGLWYRIEPSTGMPVFGLEGPMIFAEWERVVETALKDPLRRAGRILSDRRRMAGAHSVAFVKQIVRFFERRKDALGPTRWAVVTADHDAVYGMVRMASVLAEATQVQVQAFTSLTPAVDWLLEDLEEHCCTDVVEWDEQSSAGREPEPAPTGPAPL